ncbi:MAG: hypothetical protein AAFR23_02950 [Pseudomonadota bacterium]
MSNLMKFFAAAACALGLATTGASAAQMPEAPSPMASGAVAGGASLAALPQMSKPAALKEIKVAGRRGRRVGAAIALGILGVGAAIALSDRARAHRRYHRPRRYHRRVNRCDRWLRRCDRGNYRACRRYENRCY